MAAYNKTKLQLLSWQSKKNKSWKGQEIMKNKFQSFQFWGRQILFLILELRDGSNLVEEIRKGLGENQFPPTFLSPRSLLFVLKFLSDRQRSSQIKYDISWGRGCSDDGNQVKSPLAPSCIHTLCSGGRGKQFFRFLKITSTPPPTCPFCGTFCSQVSLDPQRAFICKQQAAWERGRH